MSELGDAASSLPAPSNAQEMAALTAAVEAARDAFGVLLALVDDATSPAACQRYEAAEAWRGYLTKSGGPAIEWLVASQLALDAAFC